MWEKRKGSSGGVGGFEQGRGTGRQGEKEERVGCLWGDCENGRGGMLEGGGILEGGEVEEGGKGGGGRT